MEALELLIFVWKLKRTILMHFMAVLYRKDYKVANEQFEGKKPVCFWQQVWHNNIDYDIKLFAIRF